MSFFNPDYLYLLPLGLIPVVIYFLMRLRSQKVSWGANYVLEQALEKLKKRFPLDQLLLILLRIVAVLAIVIAFARPIARSAAEQATGTGVHHVVVLDASLSMLAEEDGVTRWDRATAALRELLSTWGRGEVWSLCVVTDDATWLVDGEAIASGTDAAAVLDGLSPDESAADLAAALSDVAARFEGVPAELYVFADDQASMWESIAQQPADGLRLPTTGAGASPAYWLCPPLSSAGNLAVTRVRVAQPRVLAKHPVRVFAAVTNFGSAPVSDARVDLLVDGTARDTQSIALLPGQTAETWFDITIDQPGSHYVTARLADDAMPVDNTQHAGIEVTSTLSALVLLDDASPGDRDKFASAWNMLDVFTRVLGMTDPDDEADVFTLGPLTFAAHRGAVDAATFEGIDVVLIDSARTVDAALASQCKAYVNRGGGVMLIADDRIDADQWQRVFDADFIPATVGPARVEPLGGPTFNTLARAQFDDPSLRAFEATDQGDLAEAKLFAWRTLEPIEDDSVHVLARMGDGEPFVVSRRFQRGHVVMLAADLSGRTNNLLVREFTMPLLFRLMSEAAAGATPPHTVAPGETIVADLPRDEAIRGVTFGQRDATAQAVPITGSDEQPTAVVEGGVDRSGLYEMLIVGERDSTRVWFGVQGERVDSDLSPLPDDAVARLAETLNLQRVDDWPALRERLEADRRGADLHHWVVIALVAVLLGEMLLQRRFVVPRLGGKPRSDGGRAKVA